MVVKRKRKLSDQPEPVRRDGALCANFVNTLARPRRSFATYRELVAWGVGSGAIVDRDVQRLVLAAARRPEAAAEVLRRGLELRDGLRRILLALAGRQDLPGVDLEALNVELAAAFSARRLTPVKGPLTTTGSRCRWLWADRDGDELDRMLWPVVSCAADILSTPSCHKVRLCAAEGCDVLFVDRTSGSPRKWCSAKCGNRVRALRDYHRRVKPAKQRVLADQRRLAEERLARRIADGR